MFIQPLFTVAFLPPGIAFPIFFYFDVAGSVTPTIAPFVGERFTT